MSGVHIHKRITFFWSTFCNISLLEYSRNGIQQQYLIKEHEHSNGSMEPIVHIFAVNKGAQSLEHPM